MRRDRRRTIRLFGEAIADRLVELAALSDEPGRLTRLYLSPAHRRAADLVGYWMREAGMTTRIDALGSVVGRYRARDGGTQTLLLGSHIDTRARCRPVRRPARRRHRHRSGEGGVQIRQALPVRHRSHRLRRRRRRAFCLHARRSRALAGTFDAKALDEIGDDGVSRRQALAAFGCDPSRIFPKRRFAGPDARLCRSSHRAGPGAGKGRTSGRHRHRHRRRHPRHRGGRRASPAMPAPCRCRCATMRWRPRPKCCSPSKSGRASRPIWWRRSARWTCPARRPTPFPAACALRSISAAPSIRNAKRRATTSGKRSPRSPSAAA